jgi:hypothetical protein
MRWLFLSLCEGPAVAGFRGQCEIRWSPECADFASPAMRNVLDDLRGQPRQLEHLLHPGQAHFLCLGEFGHVLHSARVQ